MSGIFRCFHWDDDGEDSIEIYGKEIKGKWVVGDLILNPNGKPKIGWFTEKSCKNSRRMKPLIRREATVLYDTIGEALRDRTDKHGVQIFEGDVVKMHFDEFPDPEYLTVYYDKDVNGFLCTSDQCSMKVDSDLLSYGEVIGTKWTIPNK